MANFRPEQLDVTTGSTDNDTVTTKGYVDEKADAIDFWERVAGTPNYLEPKTTSDHLHLNDEESTFFTTSEFQIFMNSSSDVTLWTASATASEDADLDLVRSRGTIGSPIAVQDDDLIGNINFIGASSASNFNNGAEIRGEINGAVSAGVLPCDLIFFTNPGGGSAVEAMRLDKDKNLDVGGNINVGNVRLTGNTINTLSGDLNLNSFSNDIFIENARPSTLQFPAGTSVNEISTTINALATDNQLGTSKAIYDSFAYLAGKLGGQSLAGGTGGTNNLDLQSTAHGTKGEVRVRDGSDFLFDGAGSGEFKVEPDADAKIMLGRSIINSPVSDVAYWSHYDNAASTDYAIKQLASGRTAVNSKTGLPLDLSINNVAQVTITSGTLSVDKLQGKSASTSIDIDKLTIDTSASGFTTITSTDSANIITLDSDGSSVMELDRGATNQNARVECTTNGVAKWYAGLNFDTSDHYQLKSTGTANDIVLTAGTTTGHIELNPGSGGTNKIQQITATNDLDITCGTDKTIELQETVWDDLRIAPGAFQFAGVGDPTLASWQPGASGTTFKVYKFQSTNEVFFTCQVPHSYKQGTDLEAHVHWTPADRGNEESGKTVAWKLDYSWANIAGTFASSSTADMTDTCTGTDDYHEKSSSVAITGTGKNISSMLVCRLYRDTGDDWVGTTAAQSPALLEFDLHFEIDTIGSRQETAK